MDSRRINHKAKSLKIIVCHAKMTKEEKWSQFSGKDFVEESVEISSLVALFLLEEVMYHSHIFPEWHKYYSEVALSSVIVSTICCLHL